MEPTFNGDASDYDGALRDLEVSEANANTLASMVTELE